MNALLRKELRLILPAWIAAMVASMAPLFGTFFASLEFLFTLAGIAIVALAISSFGQEFSYGTFSMLLAQPIPRRRLWRVKISVLGAAFLSVGITLLLSSFLGWKRHVEPSTMRTILILGSLTLAAIFAGGLWTTVLYRQMAPAFWFTLLFPWSVCGIVALLVGERSEAIMTLALATSLGLQSVAAFVLARRQFLRAEDTAGWVGTITLPSRWNLGIRKHSSVHSGKQPLRALIRKEIQSHHVALFLGAFLFLIHTAVLVAWKILFNSSVTIPPAIAVMLGVCWMLWLALPLMIGSSAVAEERKQGTLESALCLPTTRRLQFTVKLIVALFLGLLLGGVMPWLLLHISLWLGNLPLLISKEVWSDHWQLLAFTSILSFEITFLSFYASSMTRGLLHAVAATVVVGAGLGITTMVLNQAFYLSRGPGPTVELWDGPPVAVQFGFSLLLIALSWLACFNFKRVHVDWDLWLRNLFALLVALTLFVIVMVVSGGFDQQW